MRKPTLQLTEHIGRQVSETLVLKRRKLLAGVVAFLVKVFPGREEGRHVGTGRSAWRRHGLLAADQLIVDVGTEFVELGWRESEELVAGFVRSAVQPVLAHRGIEESSQCHVVLVQDLLHLSAPSAAIAMGIAAKCTDAGSRCHRAGRGGIAAARWSAVGTDAVGAQGSAGDAGGRRSG